MHGYKARLERIAARLGVSDRAPMQILAGFVDPNPAIGLVSVYGLGEGITGTRQLFNRLPGESEDKLKQRASAALGWS